MIFGFLVLLCFDLLGEYLQQRWSLPVPGPLIGMFLLAALLLIWPRAATASVNRTARGLTSNMALFFIPAGVGVITQMQRIRAEWIPISTALAVSTITSLLATALVMQRISDKFEPPPVTDAANEGNGTD
jgi:holin-like protein